MAHEQFWEKAISAHLHKDKAGWESLKKDLSEVFCFRRRGSLWEAGCWEIPLTCGGEEGSCQVVRVGKPWEDPWSWGSTEEVQLPIHVQLVRIQLHLLKPQEADNGIGTQTKKIRSVDNKTKHWQQQTEKGLSSATLGERSVGDRYVNKSSFLANCVTTNICKLIRDTKSLVTGSGAQEELTPVGHWH